MRGVSTTGEIQEVGILGTVFEPGSHQTSYSVFRSRICGFVSKIPTWIRPEGVGYPAPSLQEPYLLNQILLTSVCVACPSLIKLIRRKITGLYIQKLRALRSNVCFWILILMLCGCGILGKPLPLSELCSSQLGKCYLLEVLFWEFHDRIHPFDKHFQVLGLSLALNYMLVKPISDLI